LKLPNLESIQKVNEASWTCKLALVEAKRQFVDEISKLTQARKWAEDIDQLLAKK